MVKSMHIGQNHAYSRLAALGGPHITVMVAAPQECCRPCISINQNPRLIPPGLIREHSAAGTSGMVKNVLIGQNRAYSGWDLDDIGAPIEVSWEG